MSNPLTTLRGSGKLQFGNLSCRQCGNDTSGAHSRNADYCGQTCASVAARPILECEECATWFQSSHMGRPGKGPRFCSISCKTASNRKKGGWLDEHGYVTVGTDDGPRLQHRLVMEGMVGRRLAPEETVHHRNGDRADNRPENLELWTGRHNRGARVADLGCNCLTTWELVW